LHCINWGDWLGTIAMQNMVYRLFPEAKEFVRSLGFKPRHPYLIYEKEWKGWPDFLGYEEKAWSIRKVKELLRDLIESRIIYQWKEAVLYSFLLRKGLLNLQHVFLFFFTLLLLLLVRLVYCKVSRGFC
jgi:hypothetical protein